MGHRISPMTQKRDLKVEAIAELEEAANAFRDSEALLNRDRDRLHAAVVAALRADVGPSEIERISPYDRQHIQRIRRAAGIPPRRSQKAG